MGSQQSRRNWGRYMYFPSQPIPRKMRETSEKRTSNALIKRRPKLSVAIPSATIVLALKSATPKAANAAVGEPLSRAVTRNATETTVIRLTRNVLRMRAPRLGFCGILSGPQSY